MGEGKLVMNATLVTGAGGYLGSVLVQQLLLRGHRVVAVDAFYSGDVLPEHPQLEIVRADVRHLDPAVFDGIGSVVALAAVSNDPAAALNERWTREVNELAAERLAAAAREGGARRFVFASTCGVYGGAAQVMDETSTVAPRSAYSESKLAAEHAILAQRADGFEPVALRLGTLCGLSPRMRRDLVVHAMTYSAVAHREIVVNGGEQWRPLLHVADAAAAFLACLEAEPGQLTHPVYNVVGENLRVSEIAELVAKHLDGIEVRTRESQDDAISYRVNGQRLHDDTGFAPARRVADAIDEVHRYLLEPGRLAEMSTPQFSAADTMERLLVTPAVCGGQPVRAEALPFALPLLGEAEETEVLDTLRSGWLTTGPKSKRFERMIADYVGARFAVATNSCTGALHVGLAAAGIGPGDEVITSPITWPATANVIVHLGARPVFADIDPDTLNIDPSAIEAAVTARTKAIVPVHMAGQPCDMDAITAVAAAHRLTVLEDAAHALGARYHNRRIGELSTAAAFSFYATKNLACGEGGMLVTDDEALADRARSLSMHGISKDAWKRHTVTGSPHWQLYEPGYKYNMPDITASLGLHQLPRLAGFIMTRSRYAHLYDEAFADLPGIEPLLTRPGIDHAHHLYVIRLDLDRLTVTRDEFVAALRAEGISTGIHFVSLHLQPYYQRVHDLAPDALPRAREASERIVSLPLYPKMTEADISDVIAAVTKLATAYHR
ncbi:aminotransferase class I/II-fold pyridoxal phosphate-dependent enzyme [Nocardia yunnanensis]|uniref:Aminotransferase class I/II-fold pyridoxal phosphate-dependent enzyme n=2 Tax=Nocardia yunnanensis TaxID=2382165 RepID=A0A386ZKM9_9NOCA|nr:aminotransferase class I/II-fold pyridoxal phosphate-dependent enzyme [Nocardia yunnanensis]